MRVLFITAGVVLVLVAAAMYLLRHHADPSVDPAWEIEASGSAAAGPVTVRFTGTSTLLFSDGDTAWMVDGWFSRPSPLALIFGKIEPDLEAIKRGLAANNANDLAAVIPVHSHYDHAMDAPEVARLTGATLWGSESTANIGRGWGLDEAQIAVFENRVPVSFGAFTVTPIESKHFQFPDPDVRERALGNPEITAPLVPPVGAFEYRLGKAYVLHVDHPRGSFAIVGSAGFEEGGLAGYAAQTIFLGIGGLGGQTASYRETYWRETVEMVSAERVIPIHYDSLTGPIEGPFQGQSVVLGVLSGGEENTLPFLKTKQAAHPHLTFETLPRYDEVVLFR
ncbi:MAG: MBL fold metallo-hydrolase [Pseudomonadota bacterium]